MDNKLKLLSAAILALGSTVAFAGSYSCTSQNVTIPCDTNGWHVLVEGAYIQPANDDLEFRRDNSNGTPFRQYAVEPDHKFGWRIEGGWHYDNGRDITVSWSRFDHSFTDSSVDASGGNRWHGEADFEVDVFNLEFGQMFNVGDNADMRLHFGGQYVSLDHFLKYEGFNSAGSPLFNGYKYPSEFDGFGPRAGIDWFYHLTHGFQLVSHAAMSLLVGDIDSKLLERQSPPGEAWTPYVSKYSRRTIVPHLEARVAVRYNHKMDQGMLSVEGGWHFAGIYQSIHHTLNDFPTRPIQNISNYTNHGPFLNVMFASAA